MLLPEPPSAVSTPDTLCHGSELTSHIMPVLPAVLWQPFYSLWANFEWLHRAIPIVGNKDSSLDFLKHVFLQNVYIIQVNLWKTWGKTILTNAPQKITQLFEGISYLQVWLWHHSNPQKILTELIKAGSSPEAAFPLSISHANSPKLLLCQHRTLVQAILHADNRPFESLFHCEPRLVVEKTLLMFKGNVNNSQRWMRC